MVSAFPSTSRPSGLFLPRMFLCTQTFPTFFQFIAHPYSQVMLNSVVYKGTSGWHPLSFPIKLVLVMLYTIFMPLCMLGYMLTPTNRFTKKLEIPLLKLMSQASSVVWFLVLITMSAFQDKYYSFLRLSPLSKLIILKI